MASARGAHGVRRSPGWTSVALRVYSDETWISTSMTRHYGRASRGQRCIASAPHVHLETTTFVAGLRHDQLTAPLVADGPMDGEMFLASPAPISVPHSAARRYRHSRQPQLSQGGRGETGHRRSGRDPDLSAALVARPEPHRKALRQTQSAAPQGRQTIRRGPME